jgi:hypothetical protein
MTMDFSELQDRIAGLDRCILEDAIGRIAGHCFVEYEGDEVNRDKELGSEHLGDIASIAHEVLDACETHGEERWYTGVALWPECVCDDYPRNTYVGHCMARNESEAAAKIRKAASESESLGDAGLDPDDLLVIALWAGRTYEVHGPGSLE